jgi:hypothetical protein
MDFFANTPSAMVSDRTERFLENQSQGHLFSMPLG